MSKKSLNTILIIFAVITFFIFVISFTAFYTKENFSAVCGCNLPIWVIIIAISSFGLFTGSLVYYLLTIHYLTEKKDIKHHINKLLNILDTDEKKVINFIVNNSGTVYQSQLTKELKLDKVKVSRVITNLEIKGLINKEKKGMTNIIKMDLELIELLK